jgi:nitrogen regulatory protein PII
MKLVVAIIHPEKLEAVQKALTDRGINQITASTVVGSGDERGSSLIYRCFTIRERLLSRVKVEIAVNDSLVDATIGAIEANSDTGQVGDGVILVLPVERLVRIETSEGKTWRLNGKANPIAGLATAN